MIVEEQGGEERAKYGEKVIKELSERLTKDFGEGYDQSNLRKMRQFYLSFSIWDAVRLELTWTHYRLVMRIKEKHIRDYYIEECIKSNWSTRELERQINTCAYSRSLKNLSSNNVIDNDDSNKIERYDPISVIKSPYMLEFLGLDSKLSYKEKDLEEALISYLQKFLLELGRGFTFISRQKRISYDNEKGLFWLSSRYYSPELCGFISPDSVDYLEPESNNGLYLYAYAKNNPIMYYDPSGHSAILVIGLLVRSFIVGAGASAIKAITTASNRYLAG